MKKLSLILLLLTAEPALAYVTYYPNYPSPYITNPYRLISPFGSYYNNYNYNRYVPPPTNINSCPLQASHYDANGNWVPPQRVCPSTTPQVNVNVNR